MRTCRLLRAIVLSLTCLGCDLGQRTPDAEPASPAPPGTNARSSAASSYVGSASCGGYGCHGAIASDPERSILGNEFYTWHARDRHARAYDVLTEEASRQIALRLGIANPACDQRCTACHLTPGAAYELSIAPTQSADGWVREELEQGVGCESCHGAASRWLHGHTRATWWAKSSKEKEEAGMTALGDVRSRALACVGCHVGAAPSAKFSLLRDVNHDLIAAGHPRLNYEHGVYLDNMPPHWGRRREHNRQEGSLRDWSAGQAAATTAALELLAYRADQANGRPWPELAEYDCAGCHHDLQNTSWRQGLLLQDLARKPGALTWGSWYFVLTPVLAQGFPQARELDAQQLSLAAEMRELLSDRVRVTSRATTLKDTLERLTKLASEANASDGRRLFVALRQRSPRSWDEAQQTVLAGQALRAWSALPGFGGQLRQRNTELAPGFHTFSPRFSHGLWDHHSPGRAK